MADIEQIRQWALALPHVEEGFPFGEDTLVFKVNGKIFLMISLDEVPSRLNLKSDPEAAEALRAEYPDTVLPGYHMNKKHWNTIVLDGVLSGKMINKLINDSYQLVYKPNRKGHR